MKFKIMKKSIEKKTTHALSEPGRKIRGRDGIMVTRRGRTVCRPAAKMRPSQMEDIGTTTRDSRSR